MKSAVFTNGESRFFCFYTPDIIDKKNIKEEGGQETFGEIPGFLSAFRHLSTNPKYSLSVHQNRNRNISLKFAHISSAKRRNIPTICAYSRNLSLGLRRAMISYNRNNT